MYEVEILLGPLTVLSVSDSLSTSLSSCVRHLGSFLVHRDLATLVSEPTDESLKEMEVGRHRQQPYVQGEGLVEVRLEGVRAASKTGQVGKCSNYCR